MSRKGHSGQEAVAEYRKTFIRHCCCTQRHPRTVLAITSKSYVSLKYSNIRTRESATVCPTKRERCYPGGVVYLASRFF